MKFNMALEEWSNLRLPDILIAQDGCAIYWYSQTLLDRIDSDLGNESNSDSNGLCDVSWTKQLEKGWNQKLAQKIHDEIYEKFSLLPLPPGSISIEPFRIGVLCNGHNTAREVTAYIARRVEEYNEEHRNEEGFELLEFHTFYANERSIENGYWGNATPKNAGKGMAVDFVRKRLGMERDQLICCGDSGNDISMMALDGVKSVVVGNASHELLEFHEENKHKKGMVQTKQHCTLGVMEGLNLCTEAEHENTES